MKKLLLTALLCFCVNVYAETWSCTQENSSSNVVTVFSRDGKFMKKTKQFDMNEVKNSGVCKGANEDHESCKTGRFEDTYKIHFENSDRIILHELKAGGVMPHITYIYMDKEQRKVLDQYSWFFNHKTYVYKCAITQ